MAISTSKYRETIDPERDLISIAPLRWNLGPYSADFMPSQILRGCASRIQLALSILVGAEA